MINIKLITINKKIFYSYYIKKEFEAGMLLKGWEVKSIRSGKINIINSYIYIKNNSVYLTGTSFGVLHTTHVKSSSTIRDIKLLLNSNEIKLLSGFISNKNYTIVAISLFFKKSWVKIKIGVAIGKKIYDKRSAIKKREWEISKNRLIKMQNL